MKIENFDTGLKGQEDAERGKSRKVELLNINWFKFRRQTEL